MIDSTALQAGIIIYAVLMTVGCAVAMRALSKTVNSLHYFKTWIEVLTERNRDLSEQLEIIKQK
jgi:uncharacterized membrane protein YkvI